MKRWIILSWFLFRHPLSTSSGRTGSRSRPRRLRRRKPLPLLPQAAADPVEDAAERPTSHDPTTA